MKTYGGMDVWIHVFLASALVVGKWWASRPDRFTSGERTTGSHWIGGWVGPRTGAYRNSNSDPSVVQPVVSPYTDYATVARC
jgi:hypothetical protein